MQLFCDDKRAELKSANPDTPFAEMAKLLGAAWKDAAPEEKAMYQEQHAVRSHSIAMAFRTASSRISVSPCISEPQYSMLIHCQNAGPSMYHRMLLRRRQSRRQRQMACCPSPLPPGSHGPQSRLRPRSARWAYQMLPTWDRDSDTLFNRSVRLYNTAGMPYEAALVCRSRRTSLTSRTRQQTMVLKLTLR